MFIVVLLIIALIVAIVLWATNEPSGDGNTFVPANTPAPPTTTASVAPTGPVGISAVSVENPETAGLATDGDPATAWITDCYNDKYFNGRPGVGLIVELSTPSTGTATVAIDSGPYLVDVYSSSADVAPTTLDAWGSKIVDLAASGRAGTVEAAVTGNAARYLLVLLREAGTDSGCSDNFPYRGRIGEITFAPG